MYNAGLMMHGDFMFESKSIVYMDGDAALLSY